MEFTKITLRRYVKPFCTMMMMVLNLGLIFLLEFLELKADKIHI